MTYSAKKNMSTPVLVLGMEIVAVGCLLLTYVANRLLADQATISHLFRGFVMFAAILFFALPPLLLSATKRMFREQSIRTLWGIVSVGLGVALWGTTVFWLVLLCMSISIPTIH